MFKPLIKGHVVISLPPLFKDRIDGLGQSQSKMLIVSPLVSLVDSTKQVVDSLGIRSVAWKDVTPKEFLQKHQASPVVVSICSPEHLLSPAWRNVLTDMWTPDFVTWDEAQCSVHWNFRAYTSDVCDWFRSTFTSCKNLYTSATLGI